MAQIPQNEKVLASTLAAKAKSKYEVYQLLAIEAKLYLPKVDHVTIYFLKDLMSGRRKGKLKIQFLHLNLGVKQDSV